MYFELVGEISAVEPIAEGTGIRRRAQLAKALGHGRWRKLKGIGLVRLADGTIARAEIHWYEAHGMGRKLLKVKRFLSQP